MPTTLNLAKSSVNLTTNFPIYKFEVMLDQDDPKQRDDNGKAPK